jgi:6-phosphogluconolactonase (cycloisomerase 2 family)
LEYGQKVDRRYLAAVVISPLFMLAKKRQHFLTVGFQDDDGHQQAMVFRVDKNDIRLTLVALEARTGQQVQYQDDEARMAGKG